MKRFNRWASKGTALVVLTSFPLLSFAQAGCGSLEQCMRVVAENTHHILAKVNNLPDYITEVVSSFWNLTSQDDSEATGQFQQNFTLLGNQFINNSNYQNDPGNLLQLNADALGIPVSTFQDPNQTAAFNFNDVTFSTVLGFPPVDGTNGSAYNYLKNAAGFNISHQMPMETWKIKAKPEDYNRYVGYYRTIMAIQTFNSYVMDSLVAENANGNQLTTLQNTLVQQATNPEAWFEKIGSQEIGKVIRQLLLFQSQMYVLLTQLVQTQKQLLTAQVMTNTLLILMNQTEESVLITKAQGLPPSL